MPFRDPALPLREICEAIHAIEQFTEGMDLVTFLNDARTVAAVERKLQVISEAAVRLGDDAARLCPGLPGIGNWLRHQYDRVDVETVWNTITDHLPPLKVAAEAAIRRIE